VKLYYSSFELNKKMIINKKNCIFFKLRDKKSIKQEKRKTNNSIDVMD
jgi:hypothetical protein